MKTKQHCLAAAFFARARTALLAPAVALLFLNGLGATTWPPTFTSHPATQTVAFNKPATFTAAADGADSYQWYFNNAPIAGATSSTYTIAHAQPGNAGTYCVKAINAGGSATSLLATLMVTGIPSAPIIETNPATQTVAAGGTATFAVAAIGADTYQWYFDRMPISGATDPTYTINHVQPGSAGTYYVTVSNAGGSRSSLPATLTVK